MKKTKIIFATESYYPQIDGGAVSERLLALGLAGRGYEITILAPSADFKNHVERDGRTKIIRLAAVKVPLVKKIRATIYPHFAVAEIVRRITPDIIHVHNPFGLGRAALAAGRKYGIKKIATNHLMAENLTMFIAGLRFVNNYRKIRQLNWDFIVGFHNNFDFVTSPTQTAVDLLFEHGLKVPAMAVSNGVDLNRFNPEVNPEKVIAKFNLPTGKACVLYTGRLSGEKHVDYLIEAIPLVLKEVPAHFIIGGDGREKKNLEAMAKKLKVEKFVTFTGFIDEADFPAIYRTARLFVMPSLAELQSVVTLEAMASGLPVVAVKSGALPELVELGTNGYLFKPGKIAEFAACITKVISEPGRSERMGEQSLKIIRRHAHPKVVDRFEMIYQSLLENEAPFC